MRILYESFVEKGGALASYSMLLRAMAAQFPQDEIMIACLKPSALASLGDVPNITVLPIPCRASRECARLVHQTVGLRRVARRCRPDVIWSTNLGPYSRTGFPQVMSVLNAFQTHPWEALRYHSAHWVRLAGLRWSFRCSLARCDGAMVETNLMRQYLARVRGAPARIAVIPKAVESEEDFRPELLREDLAGKLRAGAAFDAETFLYVATANPHKNHRTVVSAVQRLRSEGVNVRVAFTLTESELRRLCGRRVQHLVQTGCIVPLGWVPKQQLRAVYDACHACVMPSLLESLSSAHLEAMHWGKPQISADLDYARDLCGDASLYAAAEDPAEWAANMRRLVQDDALRSRLVAAGYARVKSYPRSWAEVASRIRRFLEEIVTAHQRGEPPRNSAACEQQ
jgi:glycosyltransferase involved in cell wall biosynthesis